MVASCRCRVFRPPPDTLTTVGTVWSGSIVSMFDSVPDSPDLDAYAKLKITSLKLSWYWGSKPNPVCDAIEKTNRTRWGSAATAPPVSSSRAGNQTPLGHVDNRCNAHVP
jgi:hypothetical protein